MSTILRVLALVPALAFAAAEDAKPAPAPAPAPAPVPAADDKAPAPAKAPRVERVRDPDLNNIDLRVMIGGAGGIGEVRDDDADTENDDFDDKSGGRFAVHVQFLRARPDSVGFVVGGGIFAASHTGTLGGVESTVGAVGIELKGGFVYRPTRNWHFELPSVVLSGGGATVETEGAPDSEDGGYSAFALQVGGFYTFDSGFQLGLELGGQVFSATVEQDVGGGVKHDIIYSGGGAAINLVGGWRF